MFVSRFSAAVPGPSRGSGSDFWFSPIPSRTASGVRVTATEALALPAVFACVKVLAESFAVMPFYLYRKPTAKGAGRTEVTDHWLMQLLAKRPNRFQNPFEFRMMLEGHKALRGNAFCQITSNARGQITELLPLHPDRMAVEMIEEGADYRYVYTTERGQKLYYTRGEIWHLRDLSDDGIMGLSPIEAARESIGEGLAMQAYSSRFFGNDAKPGGWIEYPGSFKDAEQKGKWRDSWQKLQGGANRGKVAVLERGMKYHELGLKNSDSQFIEGRGMKVADICRIFRVPPHKVGDLSRATHSNIEAQSIEFWTDTMLPRTEGWEASIRYSLLGQGLGVGPDEMLDPEFDMDRMMRGDSASRAGYYASRTQWGSITPNEVREREGDEPKPWLNHTLQPVNMVAVDENGTHSLGQPAAAQDPMPAQDPAPANTRRANVAAAASALQTRMRTVIDGNARRMARRMAAGQAVSADVLAEALAIEPEAAALFLAEGFAGLTEDQIHAALADTALEA